MKSIKNGKVKQMKIFYVGVKGVIVRDGKVLVLRSNPDHENRGERWEMPGGRMDDDESIEQTLNRELKEELPNITDIKVGEILGAHRLHKDIDGNKSLVLIYYKVSANFKGEPSLSEEHTEYIWADKQTITQLIADASQATILKTLK